MSCDVQSSRTEGPAMFNRVVLKGGIIQSYTIAAFRFIDLFVFRSLIYPFCLTFTNVFPKISGCHGKARSGRLVRRDGSFSFKLNTLRLQVATCTYSFRDLTHDAELHPCLSHCIACRNTRRSWHTASQTMLSLHTVQAWTSCRTLPSLALLTKPTARCGQVYAAVVKADWKCMISSVLIVCLGGTGPPHVSRPGADHQHKRKHKQGACLATHVRSRDHIFSDRYS